MPEPSTCPDCRSTLLEPQRRRPGPAREFTVDLRCAECGAWTCGTFSACALARLEREHSEGRLALVHSYERCVSESMEALAACLGVAFERDLVGADDFAPRRAG